MNMEEVITRESFEKRLDKNRKANAKATEAARAAGRKFSRTLEAALKLKGSIKVNDITLFFR